MFLFIAFGIVIVCTIISSTLSDMHKEKYKGLRECRDNGKLIGYYDDLNGGKFISKKKFKEMQEDKERKEEWSKRWGKEKERMGYKIKQD